jgi:rhamnose utilization protein RhaD (predicted bifunctional aldolase and dehydrogenase)
LAEADLAEEGEDLLQTVEKLIESFDAVDLVITFLEENGLKATDESLMSVAEKMIAVVNLAEKSIEDDETARISALAAELKVPEEKIRAVAEKSDKDIREIFGDVHEIVETQVKFNMFKKIGTPAEAEAPKTFNEQFTFRKGLASGFGFSD